MNIQQLEYIVAVDTYRNFVQAAEKCFITQPTLSTMIQKLEDEIGVKIFDRKKHPVAVTDVGEVIIRQARVVLNNIKQLRDSVNEFKGEVSGEIRLGIIPTVAPYLLPLILQNLAEAFPQLSLKIEEMTTEQIITNIRHGLIDLGILATPLKETDIQEYPIYYEQFFVYGAEGYKSKLNKSYLLPSDLEQKDLLLLEEGHCFRSQLLKICSLKEDNGQLKNVKFEAGSLETLIHLVDEGYGLTLIPELAVKYLPEEKKQYVLSFQDPQPTREISIVSHAYFERKKIISVLQEYILAAVSPFIVNNKENVVDVVE